MRKQRQQRLHAGGGHIRSLLAFGRQPPIDRRLRELPQQVGEQQHDADAEERARDLAAHARLRHREQVDVPELREQEEADDRHDDVDGAAKHGLVGRDESRRGGIRGRGATRRPRRPGTASCRRSAAPPPAARSGCRPPIRPACRRGCRRRARRRSPTKNAVAITGHRSASQPTTALCVPSPRISPAIGARTCHTVHRMTASPANVNKRMRTSIVGAVTSARLRTLPSPLEKPQITASRTANRRNRRAGRSANGSSRSFPRAPGQQEPGEQPGDPHGDDRDQQLHDRDPPQAVPLPERQKYREKGKREHGDPHEVERETDGQSKGTGSEGLHGRRRQPLRGNAGARNGRGAPPASRPRALPTIKATTRSSTEGPSGSSSLATTSRNVAGNATNASLSSPSRSRTMPAFSSTMPDMALSPFAFRRRGGAVELVDQELAHVLVGQARHELAYRIVRQRLRQRRRGGLRLGALALRARRIDGDAGDGHGEEADRDRAAHSIERVHRVAPPGSLTGASGL